MTDNEINAAIAESCGWKNEADKYPCGEWGLMPDYCNDLNAMAAAENHMLSQDPSLRQSYKRQLIDACDSDRDTPRHFWRATARQRAEAYLRAIGKWKD